MFDKEGQEMIDKSKLTHKDVGRWVVYSDGFKEEIGKLKGWNNDHVFVVFQCGYEWKRFQDFTGSSCQYEDLTLLREDND